MLCVVKVFLPICFDSALDSLLPLKGKTPSITCSTKAFGVRCRVVVAFSLLVVLTILLGQRKADEGKYTINYIKYQRRC